MVAESMSALGDMRKEDFKKADTWENIGGALLTAYATKKFSQGKFSAKLPPGTKTSGFSWQKNKAMNDILSKSIHGDVYNSKNVKVGEVGFELVDGKITPKALGKKLTKESIAFIEKTGNEMLNKLEFREELLNKVNEALNSGQIGTETNRYSKLTEMKKILTPEGLTK